ncbi:MAG: LamG-like jellyroll fold domain-containing protein, partial [Candidatus Aenigmatarchaeota archaeon]
MKTIFAITLVIVLAAFAFAQLGAASMFTPLYPYYAKDHTLIKNDTGTYHLFFIRYNWSGTEYDPNDQTDFGHAISDDLISWTDLSPSNQPNGTGSIRTGPAGSWDDTRVWAPHIIKYNDMYYMFYTGVNSSGAQRIGIANSTDLYNWTKYSGNPVIDCKQFSWVDYTVNQDCRDPMVIYDEKNSKWKMFFRTMDKYGGQWYVAVTPTVGVANSTDLYNWIDTGSINAIESSDVGTDTESPYVVKYGEKYYLFYKSGTSPALQYATTTDLGGNANWVFGGQLYPGSGASLFAAEFLNFSGLWIASSTGSSISFYEMKMPDGIPTFRAFPYTDSIPVIAVFSYSQFVNKTWLNLSCNITDDKEIANISFYTNISGSFVVNKTIIPRMLQPDPNIKLLMHFNNESSYGESSEIVKDFSGNGNDGSIGSKIEFVQGKFGKAIKYINNSNSCITIPHSNSINLTENSTIMFWFKPLSGTGAKAWNRNTNTFINKLNSYLASFDYDQRSIYNMSGGWVRKMSGQSLGIWTHVALVTAKSGALNYTYIYVDGMSSFASGIRSSQDVNSLQIGGKSNDLLTGVIDELAIYNRTLSSIEINNYINGGKTKYQANLSLTGLADGRYSWSCEAYDSNDAVNSSGMKYFTVDTTPPTATITYPINDIGETSLTVTFTANDANLDSCKLEWINETGFGINIT